MTSFFGQDGVQIPASGNTEGGLDLVKT